MVGCVLRVERHGVAEIGLPDGLAVADGGRPALGDHLAEVQDGDPVGDLHDHGHVVLDDEDREVALGADPADRLGQLGGLGGVHAGHRLVHQQQARLGGEGAGQLDPLAGAVRQPADLGVAQLEEAEQVEHVGDRLAVLDVLGARAAPAQQVPGDAGAHQRVPPHEGVLHDGGPGEQREVLEGAADPGLRDRVAARGAEVEAGERQRSPRWGGRSR